MRKTLLLLSFLAGVVGGLEGTVPLNAATDLASWGREFRQAVVAGNGQGLERFFTAEAFEREMSGWKYNLKNGFLDFGGTEVIPLAGRAVLLHIPTDNRPYSGETEDAYFDFIYRIYEVEPDGGAFRIVRRIEDAFNPDFVDVRNRIEIRPVEREFLIESTSVVNLPDMRLIFMLAKEFQIEEFSINGRNASYRRLGYFVVADGIPEKKTVFKIKGRLKVPDDNIQFIGLDDHCFFFRAGGFAAMPSPPPGTGRGCFFSHDKTNFDMTYVFPADYPILQYGRVREEKIVGGQKVVTASSDGEWMDNLAFYGQKDWSPYIVQEGNARLAFYFPGKDRQVQTFMAKEIRVLLDWAYSVFHVYPESKINFVVLDRFVKGGALNDGSSIITQDAQTQADDTYIHEILHGVSQPGLKDDVLWRKEGFTNFLSFDFIDFRSGKPEFWVKQKRFFLHAFEEFSEPLSALTSTRMPTYWAAYQKGPWIYRMLSAVIGEANFRKAMLEFAKKNGQVLSGPREYFGIFEKISGRDLTWFERQWLAFKENPILRIEQYCEKSDRGDNLKLIFTQEGKNFRLPLEAEIRSGNDTIRKTFWIDSPAQEFVVPIRGPLVSVRFDPEAKLFAVLKTGKTSFLDPGNVRLPAKETTYRFQSSQGGKEIEYRIVSDREKVVFMRSEEEKEAVFELSPALSPLRSTTDGILEYSLDAAKGQIRFPDNVYDIAEPIYPENFVCLLFSCLDWTKESEASLLFLRSNQKECDCAYARRRKISGQDIELEINTDAGAKTEMLLRNGVLVEYKIGDQEKYILRKIDENPARGGRADGK